jgi:hypothetical protein
MSALWTATPTTIRLEDLDVICFVLECTPADLLVCEPEQVKARKPRKARESSAGASITPRLGRNRTLPPA